VLTKEEILLLKEYRLKKYLKEKRVLCGIGLSTPASNLVEIIGYSGFDFLFIDLEHSTIQLDALSNLITTSEVGGILPIVRVPDNDPIIIRKVLEIGAEGVIIPHVNNRKDALKAVQATKFPPKGIRGVAMMVRSSKYGFPNVDIENYVKESNEGVTVIALVEDEEGVDNIEEIVGVEGIDVIMLGPADYSLSMNLPGQYDNPVIVKDIEKVIEAAKKNGKPVMSAVSYLVQPLTTENLENLIENGVRILIFDSIEGIVKRACLDIIEKLITKIQY
jgi:4-hydroxy-2-oxoheptanedioate aldolase